ncbi:hypothetical protein JDV02_005731 [Purpureocillium takamizusanense]|uniref:Uncharacterized protein n=1 Tax=Purpureocillium takamizusanense TaxID=2060973 RepID=A0A9Q8VC25_9HYPO|nr:uncharacterized protein JDV02_005731 [Purpureocillium takamizusanense]UNI19551.1 hypothetical protein JDV02_005731 [Purpureocillium takamizusanense]
MATIIDLTGIGDDDAVDQSTVKRESSPDVIIERVVPCERATRRPQRFASNGAIEIIDLTGDETDTDKDSDEKTTPANRAVSLSRSASPDNENDQVDDNARRAAATDDTNNSMSPRDGESQGDKAEDEALEYAEIPSDDNESFHTTRSRSCSPINETEADPCPGLDDNDSTAGQVETESNSSTEVQVSFEHSRSLSPADDAKDGIHDTADDNDNDNVLDAEHGIRNGSAKRSRSSSTVGDTQVGATGDADHVDGNNSAEEEDSSPSDGKRRRTTRSPPPVPEHGTDTDRAAGEQNTTTDGDDDDVSEDNESFIGPKRRGHKRKRSEETPSPDNSSGRDKRVRTEEFRLAACYPGMWDGRLTQDNHTPGFNPLAPVSGEMPPRKRKASKSRSNSSLSQRSAMEPSAGI